MEIPDTLPNTEYQVLSNPLIPVQRKHEQTKGYFGGQPVLHPEVEVRHQDLNSQKYLAGLLLQVSHWKSSSLSSVRSSHIKINITPFKVLFVSIMMHALSNSYNEVLLFQVKQQLRDLEIAPSVQLRDSAEPGFDREAVENLVI